MTPDTKTLPNAVCDTWDAYGKFFCRHQGGCFN